MKKLIVLVFIFVSMLNAKDYAVIVSSDLPFNKVNSSDLKNIFLLKRKYIDDQKVIPINLLSNNKVRLHFEKNIIKMSRKKLNKFWVKQHFRGVSPPTTQASFKSVLEFVANVPGAIGYIPSSLVNQKVKVIYEF
jgi:ABC-type phosphate transport system substrate-binding protein